MPSGTGREEEVAATVHPDAGIGGQGWISEDAGLLWWVGSHCWHSGLGTVRGSDHVPGQPGDEEQCQERGWLQGPQRESLRFSMSPKHSSDKK